MSFERNSPHTIIRFLRYLTQRLERFLNSKELSGYELNRIGRDELVVKRITKVSEEDVKAAQQRIVAKEVPLLQRHIIDSTDRNKAIGDDRA